MLQKSSSAPLGVLMLQTKFPRPLGDAGNAQTWPFPVLFKVVAGASPDRVVRSGATGLLPSFIEAGRELLAAGVSGIAGNCGFLSLFQSALAAALNVPVAMSPLMQATAVQSLLPPHKSVGILTIAAESLTPQHLAAAKVPPDSPIVGVAQNSEFARVILNDEEKMDMARARDDVLTAGCRLVGENPGVGAIIMECTNMSPYATELSQQTGLPVYSVYSFWQWFHAGLRPRDFALMDG